MIIMGSEEFMHQNPQKTEGIPSDGDDEKKRGGEEKNRKGERGFRGWMGRREMSGIRFELQ